MADIDPRDATLQAHVPTVMVPRFSALAPLECNGHRFLVADDGLWIEVRRPWLHLRWPIAESEPLLPYGGLDDTMEWAFDWDDFRVLTDRFVEEACRALPNEHAAWFVWDEIANRLVYRPLIAIDAGPAGIKLRRPALGAREHLAVDIHSHGTLAAYFSRTDDEDDAGEVKLSVVIGNLDAPKVTTTLRLCAHGLFVPLENETEPACRVCGCTESTPCEGGCEWVEPDLCSACAFTAQES
jgi:PRTRC genetic system protein A